MSRGDVTAAAGQMHGRLHDDLHRHQEMRAAIAQHKREAAELRRRHPTIAALPLTPRGLQTAAEARSRAEAEHRRLEEDYTRLAAELESINTALQSHEMPPLQPGHDRVGTTAGATAAAPEASPQPRRRRRTPPAIAVPAGDAPSTTAGRAEQAAGLSSASAVPRQRDRPPGSPRPPSGLPAGRATEAKPPTPPQDGGGNKGKHYESADEAARVRSQYELRVSSESSVGIPATLLAGFAIDMLSGLTLDPDSTAMPTAVKVEALCLGVVAMLNLAVVLVFSTLYWAGIRVFCATTRSDAVMIDAFEEFWHDPTVGAIAWAGQEGTGEPCPGGVRRGAGAGAARGSEVGRLCAGRPQNDVRNDCCPLPGQIKRFRGSARTLFFVSPFIFMIGITIHVYVNLGPTMGLLLAAASLVVGLPLWQLTALVCRQVGHRLTVRLY
eukprot:SAG22_NODE_358_length_11759_cov_39.384563_3_plen_439_part_00